MLLYCKQGKNRLIREGGISLSVHENGRIIDSIGNDDGSFSPERAGATQLLEILKMCYSGEYSYSEIKRKCCGQGGLAYSQRLTDRIADYVKFIAPIVVMAGENEMEVLALGGLRLLKGEEKAKIYTLSSGKLL